MAYTTFIVTDYLQLLQHLISIPSFSKQEHETADVIIAFLAKKNIPTERHLNNIWAKNKYFDPELPTILLNSHHDTVQAVQGWSRNPFEPSIVDGKLYGLGSNDAGASLVALLAIFCFFYDEKLPYNLLVAATAEEEISGANGIESVLPLLGVTPDVGIVGEPTQMQMAIAEKGLLVIDATAHGKAGHAARSEGINAIYVAMQDIEKLKNFTFDQKSPLLGETRLTVTQIQAGTQHNVVPDTCRFVIDVRVNECYTNQTIFNTLQSLVQSQLVARSFRLNPSSIAPTHRLVQRGLELGLTTYGSPTLSDQSLMPFPTLKIGVGDSARSHTADEFVYVAELEQGIEIYQQLLLNLIL